MNALHTTTAAAKLFRLLETKVAGVKNVAGVDLTHEMGIEYRIEAKNGNVLISAIYDEERGYEDQPWAILGSLPDQSGSYMTNDGRGKVIHTLEFIPSEYPQWTAGLARKGQDNTAAAARDLGVKVGEVVHSPKMSVGGHGFSYAVYRLVGDNRYMIESYVNSTSRHARRYAAVLVKDFEPIIEETAYRDANAIYRTTDDLGIGFDTLINNAA